MEVKLGVTHNPRELVVETERSVNLDETLFVVSSKSGGTIETLSHFRYFHEKTGHDGSRFVAVTVAELRPTAAPPRVVVGG